MSSLCLGEQSGSLGRESREKGIKFYIPWYLPLKDSVIMCLDAWCGRSLGKWEGFLCATSAEKNVVYDSRACAQRGIMAL